MNYEIIKDFPGSQDGRVTEQFKVGEVRELSESLASVAVGAGWVRPIGQALIVENKAIVTDGEHTPKRGKHGKDKP